MKRLVLATGLVMALATSANAGVRSLEATVTNPTAGTIFSFPLFTFTNLSSAGQQVTGVTVSALGIQWDWVNSEMSGPYGMLLPTDGVRTLVTGQEAANTNAGQDNGGPTAIAYTLTSFDPGEVFRFAADPEQANGTPDVIDVRPFLSTGGISITATFANGSVLSGANWAFELIDNNASPTADTNQLYRLTLSEAFADPGPGVPEPAAWALMIGGFGLAGAALRRRRAIAS